MEQFLSPTPLKVVVDVAGRDLGDGWAQPGPGSIEADIGLRRFLEETGFNAEILAGMVRNADELARTRAEATGKAARVKAEAALSGEIQRLVGLRKINDHVRPEEIESAREDRTHTLEAIDQARLRLDSIRLTVEGPD